MVASDARLSSAPPTETRPWACVAVVAHAGKSFGGGLGRLRDALATEGWADPLWFEVPKSKKAPKRVRRAVAEGADLVLVWGGDGTVQRCVDALAGTGVPFAILPAGTANLVATNLGIPDDLDEAVDVALYGESRPLDTGTVNGEHFAMMAGAGLDARMVGDADRGLKDRLGRVGYLVTGARHLGEDPVRATVKLDGRRLFAGELTTVLVGNMAEVLGGIQVFEDSRPDDDVLEIGVVTASGPVEWLRTLGRAVVGRPEESPFVVTGRGRSMTVTFEHPVPYELDGGLREPTTKLRIAVEPGSVVVRVPRAASEDATTGGGDDGVDG